MPYTAPQCYVYVYGVCFTTSPLLAVTRSSDASRIEQPNIC